MSASKATKKDTETARRDAANTPFDDNAFYHYTEIATALAASDEQVYRWLYKDRLWPYLQLKRGRRVRGAVLNRWVQDNYVQPEAK
jgi:hypothetical protein